MEEGMAPSIKQYKWNHNSTYVQVRGNQVSASWGMVVNHTKPWTKCQVPPYKQGLSHMRSSIIAYVYKCARWSTPLTKFLNTKWILIDRYAIWSWHIFLTDIYSRLDQQDTSQCWKHPSNNSAEISLLNCLSRSVSNKPTAAQNSSHCCCKHIMKQGRIQPPSSWCQIKFEGTLIRDAISTLKQDWIQTRNISILMITYAELWAELITDLLLNTGCICCCLYPLGV